MPASKAASGGDAADASAAASKAASGEAEEDQMAAVLAAMGLPAGFSTTKGKKVEGNIDALARVQPVRKFGAKVTLGAKPTSNYPRG